MDTTDIRNRLEKLGWQLLELPVKKQNKIVRWKVVASRGDKSLEVGGETLEDAITIMGKNLGVIPR